MDDLRSRVYGVLALGFRRPIPAQVEVLAGGATRQLLSDLAHALPIRWPDEQGLFGRFREDVESRGAGPVAAELLMEYCRLFLGPGGVPCPPYGSVYLDGGCVMGPSTFDARSRYQSAGLKCRASWKEPPDHICVELDFMARLSGACSPAAGRDVDVEAARLLRIQAEFLRHHLGRWGPLFAERLGEAAALHLYRFLSDFLPHWLSLDDELLRATMAEMKVRAECR